jgi:hypothetical protein
MTQDEIIEMARQAGILGIHTEGDGHWHQQFIALESFAKLVAQAEREACAKVCDARAIEYDGFTEEQNASEKLAAAIRARGEQA